MNKCRHMCLHNGSGASFSTPVRVSRRPPKRANRVLRVPRRATRKSSSKEQFPATPVRQLRDTLDFPRPVFARLMTCSERALANWESGRPLPEIYRCRLNELQNLYTELVKIVEPKSIGNWTTTPNEEFDKLKPLELIERGETFRIWRMIFVPRGASL